MVQQQSETRRSEMSEMKRNSVEMSREIAVAQGGGGVPVCKRKFGQQTQEVLIHAVGAHLVEHVVIPTAAAAGGGDEMKRRAMHPISGSGR